MSIKPKRHLEEEIGTETAIKKGIDWLIATQHVDGSWVDFVGKSPTVPSTAYAIDALIKAKLIKRPQDILKNPDQIFLVKLTDSNIRKGTILRILVHGEKCS